MQKYAALLYATMGLCPWGVVHKDSRYTDGNKADSNGVVPAPWVLRPSHTYMGR